MDPLQSFLSHLSPSRAKSPTPPTKPSHLNQSKSSQTPQTTKSRFRRHPPPELPLQSHKLSSSVSSSNLLAPHTPNAIAINPSASTSNLRATSPGPEDRPSRSKRLGMLAQPFHLPRARSPKPVKPRIQPVAEDPPEDAPSFSSLSPPLPKTESSSSLAAPSVPARSPLRGTPRSVGSFSSLLNTYQDASHSGSTLGLVPEPAPAPDTGWTQLLPTPPSPSVYSPVHSVFPEEERRVRRSTSMRAVGGERSVSASTTVGRGPRLDALRMPTTRARSASTSSPMLYEDGEMEPNNDVIERASMDRAIFRPSTRRVTSSSRPSTSSMNLPTIRDSAIAIPGEKDKDLPPPPPPKLHVRLQSEFTVPEFALIGESVPTRGVTTVDRGQGVSPTSADSGESSGFETAASHTNNTSLDTRRPSTSLSFNPHTRPGTSASTSRPTPSMVITLPSHPPPSESASTRTSVSQASLLIDSPERPYPHKPNSPPDEQREPPKSKRTHALLELLSSERAYASDLALIRDIYLPLARGLSTSYPLPPSVGSLMFPGPGPSRPVRRPAEKKPDEKKVSGKANGSGKSNGTNKSNGAGSSKLNGSEKPSSPDDPPMSAQDVKIIFGNIEELAAFADELSDRLEAALGSVVPGGVGEDCVGELFCELAPRMAPMYLTYITRHPAAVERYTALSTTPTAAMAQYLATTRAMTSSITHAWDIPSLIIKPLQRLLKYPLILQTILENTPVTMGHKDRATLQLAKDKMEQVARQVNEGRRRWEVVKGVLESGKSPPSSAKRMKTFRGRTSTNDTEAQADLVKLEKRVKQGADAANAMAEHVAGWANELTAGAVRLLAWSRAFARVVDLDVLLGGDPQGGSEAVRAFTTVAASLEDLSRELAAVIKEELVPQLQRLAKTAREPLLLLAHMHTLASAHHNLVNAPYSKSRPAALQEASQAYLALAAQLREELPRYVDMFERAFGIIVLRLSGWQARYFQEAERRWKDFWLALNVEESEVGAGESAAVETVRIWWSRWEATARQTASMSIVATGKRVYTRQPVTPTSDSASWDYVPPYHSKPSALSLGDQQSAASSSSAKGHSRAVSTDRGTQRQSDPPKGKKSQKGSNLRRVTDTLFGGTPGERSSAHSSSSRIQQPVLYTAAAIHPFNPETDATHLSLPFLTLRIGDTLEILVEAGHPSEHSNLPIPYDDAPDCMLAARNEDGLEGWALASYLMPLP